MQAVGIVGLGVIASVTLQGCGTAGDGGDGRMSTYEREIPRIVAVRVGPRSLAFAEVFERTCAVNHTGGRTIWATGETPGRHYATVYLCGNRSDEADELAHIAGMTHTAWENAGAISCATVILPGYNTGYRASDRICVKKDTRHEWVHQRSASASHL